MGVGDGGGLVDSKPPAAMRRGGAATPTGTSRETAMSPSGGSGGSGGAGRRRK